MYAIEPLKLLQLLKYPPVLLAILYTSISFGTLVRKRDNHLTSVLPKHLDHILLCRPSVQFLLYHRWVPLLKSQLMTRLLYLGNSLGYLVGSIVGGRWSDYIFIRSTTKYGGEPEPEGRFGLSTWVAVLLCSLGVVVYGWTIDKGFFVIVPEIGTFLFGLGLMLGFSTVTTYFIDAVPGRSSSAVAVNTLIRNTLACVGTILGKPLIEALGNGLCFSVLGGVCAASGIFIWAIIKVRRSPW